MELERGEGQPAVLLTELRAIGCSPTSTSPLTLMTYLSARCYFFLPSLITYITGHFLRRYPSVAILNSQVFYVLSFVAGG